MKVMSFNVLCGGPGTRDWAYRCGRVTQQIRTIDPDLFGLQEAHSDWMDSVSAALPEYDYIGVGREDGKRDGEFSPVFYRKDAYTLIDSGNFWLSETPDVPGLGWDARCIRICSYAYLSEKTTGKQFVFMNTHLDHIGPIAQKNGAQLIVDKAKEFSSPIILTGDFNVVPESEPYQTIQKAGFVSTVDAIGNDRGVTFHGYGSENGALIDFIFTAGGARALTYTVVREQIDGMYPSDHFPVVSDVEIQ